MADDDEWKNLPAVDKVEHKNWKCRVAGYEECIKTFNSLEPEDKEFSKYLGNIKKFITDTNANAQEKGCEAALLYVKNAACAKKVVRELVNGVIVKGLNGKPKTKESCIEICMMCVEIEKSTEMREELIPGLANKQPKIVAATVNILTQTLNQFGSKVFPIKPLVQKDVIKVVLEHRDGKVRDEAKALVCEMYRWLGEALSVLISKLELKDVMIKELSEEWSKVSPGPPARYTRSEQARQEEEGPPEEAGADGGDGGGGGSAFVPEVVDPYDLLEPVDIVKEFNKIKSSFETNIIEKKWTFRKEALEQLQPICETPKIEKGEFHDIVAPLIKVINKDSNIVVVQLALKCLAALAKGSRKGYASYAKETVTACLAKYKEKKVTVVAIVSDCIDAAMVSITLERVLEEVQEALGNKNPSIRQETVNFLNRCFVVAKAKDLPKTVMKTLCPAIQKLLDDTQGPVRDAAAQCLGTCMKVVGEKFMAAYTADLDAIKLKKVQDCYATAEVNFPFGGAAKPKAAPVAKVEPKKEEPKKEAPKKAPPKKGPAKKAAPKKAAPPKKSAKDKQKEADDEEIKEAELTDEQVDEIIEGVLSADIVTGLGDANWKVRLEAVQSFSGLVDGFDDKVNVQALMQVLGRKPGWKDNNIQVLKEKFTISEKLAGKKSAFTKRSADMALGGIVEKIGDIKLKEQAFKTLLAFSETISLNFVSSNMLGHADKQKSPKTHIEALNWLTEALKLFGMRINVKSHLPYLKKWLGSPNAGIRTAASECVGTISMYSGDKIASAFADQDAKIIKLVEDAIAKYKGETAPAPTLGIVEGEDDEEEGGDGGSGGGGAGGVGSPEAEDDGGFEDLVDRVDISEKLSAASATILSTNWKERKESLENVSTVLKANLAIKSEIGHDFPAGLKAGFADSNMAVKVCAIGVMKELGVSLGPGTTKHQELFVCLFPLLQDSKVHIRTQILEGINVWIEHIKLPKILISEDLVLHMSVENPNLRQSLMTWLTERMIKEGPAKFPKEIGLLVPGVYKSLVDRNGDVRKAAQTFLPHIMAQVGYSGMVSKTSNLSTGNKKTIVEILEKYKEEADALVPKKAPPKKPVTPPTKKPAPKAKGKSKSPKPPKSPEPESDPEPDPEPVQKMKPGPRKRGAAAAPVTKSEPASEGEDECDSPQQKKEAAKKTLSKKPALKAGAPAPGGKKKKGEEEDLDSPLIKNDKKNQRFKDENSLKVLKWNFKVPRAEYVEQLQMLMEPVTSPGLFAKIFHADFKQHIEALKILTGIIPTHLNEIKQSLDLLLKWISLKFFETNTSVLLASLEFLSKCFDALRVDGYMLVEQEAVAFMPYLVTKLGDSKEPVRKSVHSLFNTLCFIYPASRTFFYLSEGLKTKNSRQRSGILELETKLIQENGVAVCQPTPKKAFEYVATFIGDKDTSVRMGALNCCVAGWNFVGEDIKKMVGRLNEKDLSMLDERIKRAGKRVTAPSPAKPQQQSSEAEEDRMEQVQQAPVQQQEEPPLELDEIVAEEVRSPSPPPPKPRGEFYIDYETLLKPVSVPTYTPLPPLDLSNLTDFEMPNIDYQYNPVQQNLEGINLKLMDDIDFEFLKKIANLRHPSISVVGETAIEITRMLKNPGQAKDFCGYVNNLIMTTSTQLTHFPTGEDEQEMIVYKAIVGIVMQTVMDKELAAEITPKYLKVIFELFVGVLTDGQSSPAMVAKTKTVISGVNTAVLAMLQNCPTSSTLCALLSIMDAMLDMEGHSTSVKELELVMKCMWKSMKKLQEDFNLSSADIQPLLRQIAAFFKRLPSFMWKDHPKDTPYRTVKTLLHNMCKSVGLVMMDELLNLDEDEVNILRSFIESFLIGFGHDLSNLDVTSTGTASPNDNENRLLDAIVAKTADKEQLKSAIVDLHLFIKERPNVSIEGHLAQLTDIKRKLIEKILKDLKQRDRKGVALKNKINVLAKEQGIAPINDFTIEQIRDLQNKDWAVMAEEMKGTLKEHNNKFNKDCSDMNELIAQLPKNSNEDPPEKKKSRIQAPSALPRPQTSPSRSPVRSGIPNRNMDDLKKRLEMIKKRTKPT